MGGFFSIHFLNQIFQSPYHSNQTFNHLIVVGDAICAAGSSKRFKSSTVNMPLLLYLCDEMAKRGDEHFFRALNELGVMGKVLEKRCEHLAKTAREYGHSEFAVTIETSPR